MEGLRGWSIFIAQKSGTFLITKNVEVAVGIWLDNKKCGLDNHRKCVWVTMEMIRLDKQECGWARLR
jgi:hypothetical protein